MSSNGSSWSGGGGEGGRHLSSGGQALMTALYAFGAAANLFSLVLLSQTESARNRKLILMIRCLSANDLLALCSSFALAYLRLYLAPGLLASRWFCALRLLSRFFGFSSGSVATVMALERFLALTRPFCYQKHITHAVVKRAIFVQWFVVLWVVLLPLGGFGLYYVEQEGGQVACARYRQATRPSDVVYAYLMFGFGTAMCAVIVGCNLAVVRALRRAEGGRTTVSRERNSLAFNHTTHEEISFAKLMLLLCVCFVACWLPQMATIVVSQLYPGVQHPFFRLADVCTALHFVLDPIVYVLSRRPHRRGLRRLLKPLCQRCWADAPSSATVSRELAAFPPPKPPSTLDSQELTRR